MSKYTPGPWKINPTVDGKLTVQAENGYWVGEVWDVSKSPENEANARLITAAPDLLEALKALHERYVMAIGNEGPEAIAARAAIAKAEGRT